MMARRSNPVKVLSIPGDKRQPEFHGRGGDQEVAVFQNPTFAAKPNPQFGKSLRYYFIKRNDANLFKKLVEIGNRLCRVLAEKRVLVQFAVRHRAD